MELLHRIAIVALVAGALTGQPALDTPADQRRAQAEIHALNADILASTSATLSLERWCRERKLADVPTIVANVVPGAQQPPAVDQLRRLRVAAAADVRHRRVELRCGTRVLSIADNWYVPSRLTPEMNRLLETTTTPFGRAVLPLEPYRQTFVVNMLWTPDAGALGNALFEHRAILYTREHLPFSEVHEVYQRAILGSRFQ